MLKGDLIESLLLYFLFNIGAKSIIVDFPCFWCPHRTKENSQWINKIPTQGLAHSNIILCISQAVFNEMQCINRTIYYEWRPIFTSPDMMNVQSDVFLWVQIPFCVFKCICLDLWNDQLAHHNQDWIVSGETKKSLQNISNIIYKKYNFFPANIRFVPANFKHSFCSC